MSKPFSPVISPPVLQPYCQFIENTREVLKGLEHRASSSDDLDSENIDAEIIHIRLEIVERIEGIARLLPPEESIEKKALMQRLESNLDKVQSGLTKLQNRVTKLSETVEFRRDTLALVNEVSQKIHTSDFTVWNLAYEAPSVDTRQYEPLRDRAMTLMRKSASMPQCLIDPLQLSLQSIDNIIATQERARLNSLLENILELLEITTVKGKPDKASIATSIAKLPRALKTTIYLQTYKMAKLKHCTDPHYGQNHVVDNLDRLRNIILQIRYPSRLPIATIESLIKKIQTMKSDQVLSKNPKKRLAALHDLFNTQVSRNFKLAVYHSIGFQNNCTERKCISYGREHFADLKQVSLALKHLLSAEQDLTDMDTWPELPKEFAPEPDTTLSLTKLPNTQQPPSLNLGQAFGNLSMIPKEPDTSSLNDESDTEQNPDASFTGSNSTLTKSQAFGNLSLILKEEELGKSGSSSDTEQDPDDIFGESDEGRLPGQVDSPTLALYSRTFRLIRNLNSSLEPDYVFETSASTKRQEPPQNQDTSYAQISYIDIENLPSTFV